MRRPHTKRNIIRVHAIQCHIEQGKIDNVHWKSVDAVLAPCGVTASVEFMERAGYPPVSPDISHEDQEPIIRNREVVDVGCSAHPSSPLSRVRLLPVTRRQAEADG